MGLNFAAQSRFEQAISHFKKAIVLKPEFAEAHNNLGSASTALGRFDDAVSHFSEALNINPNFAQAQKNLASVLERRSGKQRTSF